MDLMYKIALALHITGGSVGLIIGTIVILLSKADKRHKHLGKVFNYGMLTAGFSAILLSIIHPNLFLMMVAVMTIFSVISGNRYLKLKKLDKGQKPKWVDWANIICLTIAAVGFIVVGVQQVIGENNFGIVYLVFGFGSLNAVRVDFLNFNGKTQPNKYWLLLHLQRMMGAYIASFTAFVVVNAHHIPLNIPGIVYWLLPTAIFMPLILFWLRKVEAGQKV
jgi:uncharacterized membrane protein